MRTALIGILVFIGGIISYGQSRISGHIFSDEKKPLEFAAVGIKKDTLVFRTAFTDSMGNYTIPDIQPDRYKLLFYFIGYKTIELEIKITKDTVIDAVMGAKVQELDEVIILGNNGRLERKADRFVYSIANSEITKGNSIYELLKQTPLITVSDNTNTISLVNKPKSVIYINGKRSNLSQEAVISLLKNNSSENLSRVEIITVPSSNYNVPGNTGIINIVMKKDRSEGINGSIRGSEGQASNNWQSASTNFNFRKNRLGINANAYVNNTNKRNEYDVDILFKQNDHFQEINTIDRQPQLFYGGTLGADYDINADQTLGFKMDCAFSDQKNASSASLSKFRLESSSVYDSLQQTRNTTDKNSSEVDLNANYHYNIDSSGKFFNMDVDYFNYLNHQTNYNETDLIDQDHDLIMQRQKFKQVVPQKINNLTSKIEYQHVLDPDNTFNIGMDGSVTHTDNDTYFGNFINAGYQKDSLRSFYYKYDESIYSLFATYSRNWNKKWQTSAGIRLENTNNKGEITTTQQSFSNNYLDLLPYFAIGFSPSEKNQFSYTLSNRVSRPAFWELNPFRYYTTPSFYIENNPFIQPQKHNINELSYTLNSRYTFLIDYTHTDNASEQFFLNENNLVKAVRLNYGTNDDVSAGISAQQSFLNELIQSNLSLSGGWIRYNGQAEYIIISNDATYLTASINNTINISTSKKWFGFINVSYSSPARSSTGFFRSTNNISLGIKKRYKNWTFSIWANDLLKGEQIRYKMEDDKILTNAAVYNDSRNLYCSLYYKFGNQQVKANRQRETSNTEIKNRNQR